jgi:hypothetical protein
MWGQMAEWFNGDVEVSVPDDEDLLSQLCGQRYDYKAHGKIVMLDKRQDGLPSPDKGDALALTFALPESKLQQDSNLVKELIAFNNNPYYIAR